MAYDVKDVGKALVRRMAQLDYVTNNIANANTPGYKAERLLYTVQEPTRPQSEVVANFIPYNAIDFAQGVVQRTGNPLDVAIQGDGYFAVQTKSGTAYTRKGDFIISPDNRLLTQSGDEVQGDAGPITIEGNTVLIDNQGGIGVDGTQIGRLSIVAFDRPTLLVKRGDGLLTDPGTAGRRQVETPEVMSGHLETSNVQAVKEMVDMIDMQRAFEVYQKVILTMQDQDRLSTTRVGRLT